MVNDFALIVENRGTLMSTEPTEPGDDAPPPPPASGMHLAYAGASRVQTAGNTAQVELFGNLDRPPVKFEAKIKNPLRFRLLPEGVARIAYSGPL